MASTLTVDKIKGGSSGVALTLPTTDGSAGQLLKTNGSAVLSWATDVDTGITDVVDDTTPQLGGDLDCNGAQIQWSKGADVASATALPVLTDGNYFDVTGTTTVTSINTTGGAGTLIKLHFDAILILTHHATDLILPGGANITTAAGDEAEFIEYATGDYRCTNYSKADGTSVVGGLDDNSVTLAKMAGGTDGNLITYDASGDPAYVTTGTSGQVLTSGGVGVAPTFQAAAGGGKVLQVLQSVVTDTISQSGGGTGVFTDISGFSISITPSSTTSKILIMVEANASCSSTGEHFGINLLRGSTVLGGHTSLSNRSPALMSHMTTGATNKVMALGGTFLDSPSTTSATTYKVQSYSTSQTFYLNRTSSYSDNNHRLHGISTITVMEIGA